MTEISLTHSEGQILFSATGHACFAKKGKDIVCAGISALCISLLERIKALENEGDTEIKKCVISDGSLILHFTETKKAAECCKTVLCGFEAIANSYPDYCRLFSSLEP